MRARWLGLMVAALVAAAAGWWFASPWWTLRAMREAAAAHDEKALSAHVDYPALRESVKSNVMRRITTDGRGAEGLGAIGALVADAIAGPLIKAAVTPQGVEAMFRADYAQDKAARTPDTPGVALPKLPPEKDRPVIERHGLNEFTVRGREAGGATLLFHRDALGWKLAGFDLPPPPAR